jgi:hypothetical protein
MSLTDQLWRCGCLPETTLARGRATGRQAVAVATLMGIVNDNDDGDLRALRIMGRHLIVV